MKILITGGAGFIGTHLADLLVGQGNTAVALDTLSPQVHQVPERSRNRFPGPVIIGDVRDQDAVRNALSGCHAVVHLAAETGVAQSMTEPDHYRDVNVHGTRVVAAEAANHRLTLIIASSRAVYGEGAYDCATHGRSVGGRCCAAAEPDPSREQDAHTPISVYGKSKSEAERVVRQLRPDDVAWEIVRPQNVIGPGQAPHNPYTGVLAAFSARLRSGLPPQVYGTGHQTRDFIDVRDVARQIGYLVAPAEVNQLGGLTTTNLGAGTRTSLLELAQTTIAASRRQVDVELVDRSRPGDIEHACADLSIARKLGLPAPQFDLLTSVTDFIGDAWEQPVVDPRIWDRAIRSSERA